MKKLSSRVVMVHRSPVFWGASAFSMLDRMVKTMRPSDIHILVDANTKQHCLPVLVENTTMLANAAIMETMPGEQAKSISNAEKLWNELAQKRACRSSLLINLGGGVISDLGGFIASGYMRGIRYINLPTSLIGQADAAIGGKTGVNLGNLKNLIGTYYPAEATFIVPAFLKTLPVEHLRSGLGEIIKIALAGDQILWRKLLKHPVPELLNLPVDNPLWQDLIVKAVIYKNTITTRDFRETKLRKILNFGHTLGHVFESHSLKKSDTVLSHGDAVAAGMICSAYLSCSKTGLENADLLAITNYILAGYGKIPDELLLDARFEDILKHDKKGSSGRLLFTLITKPGSPLVNIECTLPEIWDAIGYYRNLECNKAT